MRRYTIFILTAIMLVLAVVAGMALPVDADKKTLGAPMQELTAYTTLPAETAAVLSEVYERENKIRVNFVPMTPNEILQEIKNDAVSDPTVVRTVDIVVADSKILREAAQLNLLTPHTSEASDAVKDRFKDEFDRWTGIWYDPIIFCANRDYLRTTVDLPDTWEKLSKAGKIRVGITDFLAAEASANLMFQMIGNLGDAKTYEILSGLHPKVIQYAKFLSNPVRQAGMGEVDLSVAVESETLRYLQNGYPLKIIYPADGTSYLLTGFAITTTDATRHAAAAKFADWLLSDEAQLYLQTNGFYFIPTNPQTLAYKSFAGKNLLLFDNRQNFSEQQQRDFLDRWIKDVRLK
ncbi:MAG: extracellular solute-binding protein [Selenomonadaceae bacterium]|nr:extracellular solute-binding protein [Selenomonadaceae bacterium]MBR0102600.1 extracellular solute-binding protein [Selenomonadaceae bacterium]